MKLCQDCKNYKFNEDGFDKCLRPSLGLEPVRGLLPLAYCKVERGSQVKTDCGKDAQWYEEKLP